ncbi:MAG: amidohydrolase family protein, partial [Desulfobacterales bacterium]|nr:amidohydrolase family protein [Desulfobacterales bacterium]
GNAVLTPPLINAHTHLELSALKGRVPCHMGFEAWVKSLLKERGRFSHEALLKAAGQAVREAMEEGTLFFAEISSLGITQSLYTQEEAKGVWFLEQIGNSCGFSSEFSGASKTPLSVAAHAPHTTDPLAICAMKKEAEKRGLPFSIHVDESAPENEFITTAKGAWADFLNLRGIDWRKWPLPADNPVRYLLSLGVMNKTTLAVHLLNSSNEDFDILAKEGVTAVCCPRSNLRLHGKSPRLKAMVEAGLTVALGTDSLASCESLSIKDEMLEALRIDPMLSGADIFQMATENGAKALGMWPFVGRIASGVELPLVVWHGLKEDAFSFDRWIATPQKVEVIT